MNFFLSLLNCQSLRYKKHASKSIPSWWSMLTCERALWSTSHERILVLEPSLALSWGLPSYKSCAQITRFLFNNRSLLSLSSSSSSSIRSQRRYLKQKKWNSTHLNVFCTSFSESLVCHSSSSKRREHCAYFLCTFWSFVLAFIWTSYFPTN